MERETDTTVVFIFVKDDKVLLEKRPLTSSFAGMEMYPGGSVKENELDDLESALRREVLEELGVTPIEISALLCPEDIYGETGKLLRPYLISTWDGTLSQTILDKGNPVSWVDLEIVANAPLESVRRLTTVLRDHLAKQQ